MQQLSTALTSAQQRERDTEKEVVTLRTLTDELYHELATMKVRYAPEPSER